MSKFFRRSARVLLALLSVIVVCWIVLAVVIHYKKDFLRERLASAIAKRTHGEVSIERVSASFFETFPFISVEIEGIGIRDSLFNQHKHELFHGDRVFLRISPLSLLTSQRVGKVIVRGGSMYLFKDTAGYTNNYLLRGKDSGSNKTPAKEPPSIRIENFNVEVFNPGNRKHHKGHINQLDASFSRSGSVQMVDIRMDVAVTGLGFNTRKGYFLGDSRVRSNFDLSLDDSAKTLAFENVILKVNKDQLRIAGKFSTDEEHHDFALQIEAVNADYNRLSALMPAKINKQLAKFSVSSGIDLSVSVQGKTSRGQDPKVIAKIKAIRKDVHVPDLDLTDCSFEGTFNNWSDTTQEPGDPNTVIRFKKLTARLEGIPVRAEETSFHNLERTFMKTDIHADFPLTALNKQFDGSSFDLNGGHAIINARFEGPIAGTDSTASKVEGYIRFRNGALTYRPRNIKVTNLDGDLLFKEKDLVIPGLTMNTGKSSLRLEGRAANFLSFFNISPETMNLSWNVSSKELFLDDYKTFLGKKSAGRKSGSGSNALSKATTRIDKIFTDGNVHLTLTTPSLHYRKFNATNVNAAILLTNDYVDLENVSLAHAEGTIGLKGRLTQGDALNKLQMSANLSHINVPQIFEAFSDFGQDAITSKNLKGVLSAAIKLETFISDKAKMSADQNKGTIRFLLQQGELHNFEPVEKISEKAMKKQDFSDIRFADLENELEVKGTAFIINKMEIRSTAITMFVEGVYDTKKGTDMSIQLPVRNLLKSNANTDLSEAGKDRKGISVRLRAHTGEDGKLQVGWDPFKKAVKNKEAMAD